MYCPEPSERVCQRHGCVGHEGLTARTYALGVFWKLQRSAAAWVRTNWLFDPVVVIAMPLVVLFYVAVAIGPLLIVLFWGRPPLILGVATALLGLGVIAWLFVEGFNARFLAVASRQADNAVSLLHEQSWALVMRAVLATAWLVPVVGVWSAAIENELHPARAELALDYASLALWQVGDVVPLLNVPRTLGHPLPPVSSWGLGTGIALLVFSLFVVYSIIVVVTELVTRRGWPAHGT